jgi:glutamate synthase domain-containing protein 2
MIHRIRHLGLPAVLVLALVNLWLIASYPVLTGHPLLWTPAVILLLLLGLGIHDVTQEQHSILRSYPILGHIRFFFEDLAPELHQYFVEANTDGKPFSRDERALAYRLAKGDPDVKAFGTELEVYGSGYSWLAHSIQPKPVPDEPASSLRVRVGDERCAQPYDISVLNISGMSYGALGANAIRALNEGAAAGGFAHNTGEGSISEFHLSGGDLIWQIGTGYFGCRTKAGELDYERFAERAQHPAVKMIEIKISQGAKPGHGGLLPGAKVVPAIAATRGIPVGETCISPPYHRAFSTPRELLEVIARLRELSGGKPVGFKICLGDPVQYLCIVKAMQESGMYADFITIDGAEGGTGAAPLEFSDHIGMPLVEALVIAKKGLVGAGIDREVRVAASGKLLSGFDMAMAMALGADWCNQARGFMFALGCIQAQKCHTNACPVGVTTQDARLQRSLVVPRKAERVQRFHAGTVQTLAEIAAAAGLDHPCELRPRHIWTRVSRSEILRVDDLYKPLRRGELLSGGGDPYLRGAWSRADSSRFDIR